MSEQYPCPQCEAMVTDDDDPRHTCPYTGASKTKQYVCEWPEDCNLPASKPKVKGLILCAKHKAAV